MVASRAKRQIATGIMHHSATAQSEEARVDKNG